MAETLSSGDISTKLLRIAELSRAHPERAFTSLAHGIDVEWLREAYRRTRKDGAVGVDGETAAAYAADLEANLQSLADRLHSGTYRAPAVRRVYIPKGDGRSQRPIGIPTFEDKVLQRAVAMVLEAVYEQDFLDCSYGFRPNRSAHQALAALWHGTMSVAGGWVLELDIRSFYDEIDHEQLRSILDRRVRDGVVRCMIHKWLKAGVLEEGQVSRAKSGTPQGGVISPLLANVYLHEVLDAWFEREIKPRLRGRSQLVRFADDAVLLFEHEHDARRVMAVLGKRFDGFGLRLHPDKTRLVRFLRPGLGKANDRPESFDFLGFTHHWGKSRRQRWVVKQRTAKARLSRSLKYVNEYCRTHRHLPVPQQHQTLSHLLRGHYSYYGITGNARALGRYWHRVRWIWQKWLARRSQRAPGSWERFGRILESYPLPPPRAMHSAYRLSANP